MTRIGCGVEECERPVLYKGLCSLHWNRMRRYGEPGPANKAMPRGRGTWPLVNRFCSKLIWTQTCVEWTGAKTERGYGRIVVAGKQLYAHRVSYELFVGPIPDGLTIDHLCENTSCVWPEHLEAVSLSENARRYNQNHRITHCVNGHELTPENTYVRKEGWRMCVTCKNAANMRAYYRKITQ